MILKLFFCLCLFNFINYSYAADDYTFNLITNCLEFNAKLNICNKTSITGTVHREQVGSCFHENTFVITPHGKKTMKKFWLLINILIKMNSLLFIHGYVVILIIIHYIIIFALLMEVFQVLLIIIY